MFESQNFIGARAHDLFPELEERERELVELRYGLVDGRRRTLKELGEHFEISRERVRQIERRVLLRMRGRNVKLRRFAAAVLAGEVGSRTPIEANRELRAAFQALPDSGKHPDRWMELLAKAYPEFREFLDAAGALDRAEKLVSRLMGDSGNLHVERDTFLSEYSQAFGPGPAAATEWQALSASLTKWHWSEGAAVFDSYKAMARHVLSQAGVGLHWHEITDRMVKQFPKRDVVTSSAFNAIQMSDLFVRTGSGTYGLAEWGINPTPFQKDVLAAFFAGQSRSMTLTDVQSAVRAEGHDIPDASVMWYLIDHPLFYEDVDGLFGLRDWLPPPDEQTLATPRWLRESRRSSERRGPLKGE